MLYTHYSANKVVIFNGPIPETSHLRLFPLDLRDFNTYSGVIGLLITKNCLKRLKIASLIILYTGDLGPLLQNPLFALRETHRFRLLLLVRE